MGIFAGLFSRRAAPPVADAADSGGEITSTGGSSLSQIGFGVASGFGNSQLSPFGQGGAGDKGVALRFQPAIVYPALADTLYAMSWVAAKMVEIPVEDMWARGLQFRAKDDPEEAEEAEGVEGPEEPAAGPPTPALPKPGSGPPPPDPEVAAKRSKREEQRKESEETVERMKEVVDEFDAHDCVMQAQIAARLYGGSLVVMMPRKGIDPASELVPEEMGEGDLANLIVVHRWWALPSQYVGDPQMAGGRYGKPYMYTVTLRTGDSGPVEVHHSRCLRLDGRRAPITEGWPTISMGHRDWGISILTPAIEDIYRDTATAGGIAHLIQESSILQIKTAGFDDMYKGRTGPREKTLAERASEVGLMKSLWRTVFTGETTTMERIQATFAGLADLMDRMAGRCAAIADIPITRFLGQSPAGLNSTGDGDLKNYAMKVEALRNRQLTPILKTLHMVLARHAGLDEPPDYDWLPVMEETGAELATMTKAHTEAAVAAVTGGLAEEEEARTALARDPFWEGMPPEMPESLEVDRGLAAQMEQTNLAAAAAAAQGAERDANAPPAPPGGGPPRR